MCLLLDVKCVCNVCVHEKVCDCVHKQFVGGGACYFSFLLENLETDCVVFHAYIHTWLLAEMPSALRTTLSSTFCSEELQITTATV